MSDSAAIAMATVLTILVIIDIVGNSLVCAIIKKNRDMRYVDTVYMLHKKSSVSTASIKGGSIQFFQDHT